MQPIEPSIRMEEFAVVKLFRDDLQTLLTILSKDGHVVTIKDDKLAYTDLDELRHERGPEIAELRFEASDPKRLLSAGIRVMFYKNKVSISSLRQSRTLRLEAIELLSSRRRRFGFRNVLILDRKHEYEARRRRRMWTAIATLGTLLAAVIPLLTWLLS